MRILLLLGLAMLAGCSNNMIALDDAGSKPMATNEVSSVEAPVKTTSAKEKKTLSKFMVQYKVWQGAPYKLGGTSVSGVDCSGFVYRAYQDQLNRTLPRTTAQQVLLGKKVNKSKLRIGDLVFFKTSFKVRHVGIYIGDGKFMHASTSKGVTISYLDNVYWASKYWTARRLS